MRVLGIDTASSILAVGAWGSDGTRVDLTGREPLEHSRRLVTAVAEVLEQAGWRPHDLDLIAVTRGPGSYTGLRLGAMVAKTLGWAAGAPLVGVDALAVLAANAAGAYAAAVAVLPARRERVHARAYRLGPGGVDAVVPQPLGPAETGDARAVLARLSAAAAAAGGEPALVGEGVPGQRPGALDVPRGSVVARLGHQIARDEGTVTALAFVPWYAGSEVATPARGGWGSGTDR